MSLLLSSPMTGAGVSGLQWGELPALPPSAGQSRQPGVAGPFAGVHGDALIVAGGANFPDKLPWEGGAKIWWNDIWVLEHVSGSQARWVQDQTFKLRRRMGYGISVSTPDGVVCAGGHDADRCYADVFLLAWDTQRRAISQTALPAMPQPLSFMTGALVGQTLFVAGGQNTMKDAQPSAVFWALDLSKRGQPDAFKWSVLPSWPGPPRILAVAAAQHSARGEELFLFSGRQPRAGGPTVILSDAYAFDPKAGTWRTLPSVGDGVKQGLSVMGGTAAAVGDREILLFGGDRGELFLELEAHDFAIAAARSELVTAPPGNRTVLEREIGRRLDAKRRIYDSHPGFAREVLAFDTRRETWRTVGQTTMASQVTTLAVPYRGAIILPSGEIKPGIRTPAIVRVTPVIK